MDSKEDLKYSTRKDPDLMKKTPACSFVQPFEVHVLV
jgi:hypothetical protein